jgi:hypothetical protein
MIDPSKPSPWGGSSPRSNPLGLLAIRDPKVKIAVLVVLLVLVVGGMVSLNRYAKAPEAKGVVVDLAPSVEVKREVVSGVPALDTEVAENLTDYGTEARRRWPGEAIHYLLLEAANTPAVYAYARNLLPLTPGSAAEIEKDSRPWRFKYVRFRGELEYLREEDYEAVYGPPAPPGGLVWRGRVRVADGPPALRVVFVTTTGPGWFDYNEPVPVPEMKLIEDGWVRGRGILVENYIDSSGGEDVPALLVVATGLERDFATVKVGSLRDVPFSIIRDDPAIASTEEGGRQILAKEYPQPLYRLVKYAEGWAGGAGAGKRAEGNLKPEALATREVWEEMVGQPAKFRGRYFGGLGALADTPLRYVAETITPNDAGVEECLNGWLVTDQQKLMQFIAPASLDLDWQARTRVRWEGFFYKTKLYPARDGQDRLAPVFVLTVLEAVKPPPPNTTIHLILAGGFVAGMLLLAYIVLKDDRTKQSYTRFRQRRVAAERPAD